MAGVTLTITLSDIEAPAFATLVASLGPEQFEHAYQHWLNHWTASWLIARKSRPTWSTSWATPPGGSYEALAGCGLRCSHSVGTATTV